LGFRFVTILLLFSFQVDGQNLDKYFSDLDVDGVICIYDLKNELWIKSDAKKAKVGTLPASTFKVLNTLIGLEENIVNGRHDTIRWDKKPKLFKSFTIQNWNKDNDLEMAFKNSTVWYYEEISKQIKRQVYSRHLRKAKYSNRKIKNSEGSDFWNFGDLKVTPIEQVELLKKLYHNQLLFKIEHQELTKELMIETQSSNQVLRSKTGWCYDKLDIGWYIGYLEIEDNVIFFATRITKPLSKKLDEFSKLRKSITKNILSDLYDLDLK